MEQKRRNVIVIVSLLVVMAAAAGASIAISHKDAPHDSIGVFDIQVDRHSRAWADIVFDHPVEVATVGEIVSPPPATIDPQLTGVWRWHAQNVLRFEPAGGFAIGQTYTIALNTKRFITATERFRGSDTLTFKIDALMVEKVVTTEEPVQDRKSVILKGEITNDMIEDNPLGLIVTDFHEFQGF